MGRAAEAGRIFLRILLTRQGKPFEKVRTGYEPTLLSRQPTTPCGRLPATMGKQPSGDRIELVYGSLDMLILRTWLLGLFGAMALTLAAAGIFGVISYSVSRRTHEFGIRMALGASQQEILRLVLKEALRLALAGVGAGIIAALGLTRLISSLLYGVRPTDPTTLIVSPLLLTGAALLAAYLPARRATSVDPMLALRHE